MTNSAEHVAISVGDYIAHLLQERDRFQAMAERHPDARLEAERDQLRTAMVKIHEIANRDAHSSGMLVFHMAQIETITREALGHE